MMIWYVYALCNNYQNGINIIVLYTPSLPPLVPVNHLSPFHELDIFRLYISMNSYNIFFVFGLFDLTECNTCNHLIFHLFFLLEHVMVIHYLLCYCEELYWLIFEC